MDREDFDFQINIQERQKPLVSLCFKHAQVLLYLPRIATDCYRLGKLSVLHVDETGMTLKIAVHIVFNSVFKKIIMYDPESWSGPHQTMVELFLQK